MPSDQNPWQVNNTLYISGQIGFVPETMEVIRGGVVAETKQALTNMGGWIESLDPRPDSIISSGFILEAANSTFDNVVKTTVLLADINDFAAVNAEYTKFFKSNYPARAAYQVCKDFEDEMSCLFTALIKVAALPRGARVEIEAVAVVGNITNVP